MGRQMKKLMTLLIIALLFCIGCANDEVTKQLEDPNTTEQSEQASTEEPDAEGDDAELDQDKDQAEDKEEEKNSESTAELNPLTVHYIDAGQGDAALLEFTDNEDTYTILYDAGDWQGNEVVPYLQKENIDYIDIIMISHPHADHMGQLEKVLSNFDVGEVWMTGNTANSGVFEKASEAILASDADYEEPEAGDVFDVGALTVSILHPKTLTGGLNEDSLSVHFQYGETSFLFTGDAYTEQEQQMISSGTNVDADFLQLGHHGSKTSSGQAFIDAVNPEYAIYSAGAGNSYGHPHQEVLDRLLAKDVTIFGTDVHGNIMVTTDGVDATITTDKEGTVAAGSKKDKDADKTSSNPKQQQQKEQPASGDCIDLNKASKGELQNIIHLGDTRAEQVLELRPFNNVEDLQRVDGIGPARIADIVAENKACVGGN